MGNAPSILRDIADSRRAELRRDGHAQGIAIPAARDLPIAPFCATPTLVCEVKRQSPSKGAFVSDFNPVRQAGEYVRHGARACSVLTERRYFGGNLADLQRIKRRFPELALLRKDFLLDEEDVAVSCRAGADAILLIAALLSAERLADLHRAAERLGMRALVEVHTAAEIRKVRTFAPSLVGINCRNLRTFDIDLLHPLALINEIDWKCDCVFESGISHPQQVDMVCDGGFSSLLVGEAVMRQPDLIPSMRTALSRAAPSRVTLSRDSTQTQRSATTRLRPSFWSVIAGMAAEYAASYLPHAAASRLPHAAAPPCRRPIVKICGITNRADALRAVECGADLLGVILCPSPRQTPPDFIPILSDIPIPKIAVIDDDPLLLDAARQLYHDGAIDALQIHGEATIDALLTHDDAGLTHRETQLTHREARPAPPYYQALSLRSSRQYERLTASPIPRTLIDAYSSHAKGGTGRRIADTLLAAHPTPSHIWLAGGITPDNVADIIALCQPELIDISSGIERAPGTKDHAKMARLFGEIERLCGGRESLALSRGNATPLRRSLAHQQKSPAHQQKNPAHQARH